MRAAVIETATHVESSGGSVSERSNKAAPWPASPYVRDTTDGKRQMEVDSCMVAAWSLA